jgi:nicotinamidase-related amidase
MIMMTGPEIGKSALIIVDMQNDFVHCEGSLAYRAHENPGAGFDMSFIMGTIPHVKHLAEVFRMVGRPVVYIAHVVKPDYSDARFPYWRLTPPADNRTFIVESSWGAQIVDDLKPQDGDHQLVKKGFDGFSNTSLDLVLRNMGVTTCVVVGVMTGVCVSSTVRGGTEHNYRMIVVRDAVADVHREIHAAELRLLDRVFADVRTTDDVVAMFANATSAVESRSRLRLNVNG